ncbi:MAG TPA: YggS family pyridoxal phosphate-dependent enzyme [Anaerolineales bacterium]|nr:YggS family pyridoxal phosphate-dependent enzyme [Anaerolineales bacterium]
MAIPMTDPLSEIRRKHGQVLEQIAAAAQRSGRPPEAVRLVVVTKSQPLAVVQAALRAGARVLGENYAEEAVAKIHALREQDAKETLARVEWHMIGHVQGRKAKLVAQDFELIHSLDSTRLAERLSRLGGEGGRPIRVLLEFNVGGEPEKLGWPAADEASWPLLLDDAGRIADLPNISIRGLMTMPPLVSQPEASRVHFRRLRRLQEFLAARLPKADWSELSMGTSVDYLVAVEEGATLVRIGEAILGPRPPREFS